MNVIAEFKEKLHDELKTINKKNEMSQSDMDVAGKIICALKEIEIIEAMEREEQKFMGYGDGSSEMYRGGMMQMPDASYASASSMRRMPRYSMNGGRSYAGGYSRTGGYDAKIAMLENMLNEAQSEPERQAILAHINQLESM